MRVQFNGAVELADHEVGESCRAAVRRAVRGDRAPVVVARCAHPVTTVAPRRNRWNLLSAAFDRGGRVGDNGSMR